jgi:hypothetical protein
VVAAVKDEEEIMDDIEEGGIIEKASDRGRRHDRRKS